MKVGQLREALQQRGLDTAGLKAQLVERLTEAICGAAAGVAARGPLSTQMNHGTNNVQRTPSAIYPARTPGKPIFEVDIRTVHLNCRSEVYRCDYTRMRSPACAPAFEPGRMHTWVPKLWYPTPELSFPHARHDARITNPRR